MMVTKQSKKSENGFFFLKETIEKKKYILIKLFFLNGEFNFFLFFFETFSKKKMESKQQQLTFVIGYKSVGKDTFIEDLQNSKLRQCHNADDAKWTVYSKRDNLAILKLLDGEIKRYSFADALKIKTHDFLKLKGCSFNTFDEVKETAEFQNPTNPLERKTIRQFYIDLGQQEKLKNANVWTQIVHDAIYKDQLTQKHIKPIISDFRFKNEILIPKQTTTVRLFRKQVPIPPFAESLKIDSEHNLDDFESDYLLLPPGQEEFDAAIELFPQYANFKPLLNLRIFC